MRSFPIWVRTKGSLAAAVASVLLIGYIGFLVTSNYMSERQLHDSALERLGQDTENRAMAVSYFFSERKNDLKDLSESRVISAFFENRALGMSMEYGLRASLLTISESFARLIEGRKLDQYAIYTAIVFIGSDGKILVERHLEGARPEHDPDWKGLLNPETLNAPIILTHTGTLSSMIVSIPCFFKNKYAGQIVAWISPRAVYHLIQDSKEFSGRPVYIVCKEHYLSFEAGMQTGIPLLDLPEFENMQTGKAHRFEATRKDGNKVDMFAVRASVQGTPLSLVTLFPTTEIFGHTAPWHLPLAMGVLAIFLLGGMAFAFRINTRNLVLHARLDESSKREQEIEGKNRQLKREISERRIAEDALHKAHNELEIRVEERTKELAQSNLLLKVENKERKKAEEGLRREKEKFQALVEESPFGISIIGRDGHYRYSNPGFTEIFGYGLEDISTGREWFRKAFPDAEYRHQVISTWIDDEKESKHGEPLPRIFTVTCKDGSQKEIQFIPVILKSGDQFVIYEDISKENKLEAQLRQAQKMEAVGRLAGGVAHDFNNVLMTIMGYADLALMSLAEDDPLRRDLKEIKGGGKRAASLTRQLLAFSRKQILQPVVLDLNELIKGFVKMLGRLIGEDVELETLLAPGLRRVEADPGQMEQVIMNLVINARDAMPDGGKLTIETVNVDLDEDYAREHDVSLQPGPYVMLAMSDVGMGMDEETRSLIFEPFFTTKEEGKGTGLGLSTVYGIVKQSGGYIWVYSEPGQGTTFKIYLPAVEADALQIQKEQISSDDLTGSETILIVEDDDALRKLACKILQPQGYSILEAKNGIEALRISEEHGDQIHLMITDVVMPKMGGRELAEHLRPLRPEMKVIYMSGYTDNAILHHGVLRPEIEFLQKPISPETLKRKVREVLDQ